MDQGFFRNLCGMLAILSMAAGGLGMAASFLFLASPNLPDNIAGSAGFIAGAIFMAGGLVALTLLAAFQTHPVDRPLRDDEHDLDSIRKQ